MALIPGPTIQRIAVLCDRLLERVDEPLLGNEVAGIRTRLSDPLRIVLAGPTGSGRSTIIRSIVGAEPAPSTLRTATGGGGPGSTWHDVRFDGMADVVLGETAGSAVFLDRSSLVYADTTQLTPGTIPVADAFVYVFSHRPPGDPRLVAPLLDPAAPWSSPINAMGVLGRADEIGAGRREALAAAERVATRFADDPAVDSRCDGVVALAARLAAYAPWLSEADVAMLRSLLTLPAEELALVVVSPSRFLDAAASPMPQADRAALLDRLGLFGVRAALRTLRAQPDLARADLVRTLLADTGLPALLDRMRGWLGRTADLKAGSAFEGLRVVQRRLQTADGPTAEWLAASLDAVEETELAIAERAVLDRLCRRSLRLNSVEVEEIRSLILGTSPAARLRQPPDAPRDHLRTLALGAAKRWAVLGTSPVAGRAMAHTCATLVRLYERLAASVDRPVNLRSTVLFERDDLPGAPGGI